MFHSGTKGITMKIIENSKQFNATKAGILRSNASMKDNLAAMVNFGLRQACQVPTEDNPDLQPNFAYLSVCRAVAKDTRFKLGQYDQYIQALLPVEFAKVKGGVTCRLNRNDVRVMDDLDLDLIRANDGRFFEMEIEAPVKTDAEKEEAALKAVEKAIKKATDCGITGDQLLDILMRVADVEPVIVEPVEEEIAALLEQQAA